MSENSQEKEIKVIAYSGYKANERPLYFLFGQQKREVKKVLDQWHGQDHDYFRVLADDGRIYLLKWHRISDIWFLVKVFEKSVGGENPNVAKVEDAADPRRQG